MPRDVGHRIDRNVKKVKSCEIAIRFQDSTSRIITQDNPPAWRPGDKLRLVDGVITAGN
jgi:outer membrane lipoprotein SlyB